MFKERIKKDCHVPPLAKAAAVGHFLGSTLIVSLLFAAVAHGSPHLATDPNPKAGEKGSDAEVGIETGSTTERCKINPGVDTKGQWLRPPDADRSVTQHRMSIAGKSFDYAATAGTLIVRDDEDKPSASISYIAYVRHSESSRLRPIMFAFNGGPGSSSLWLLIGALGPKRVVVSDPGPTPPGAYHTVENQFSVLDHSDLVIVDAVGTGLSHAVCAHKDEEFFGVDSDIDVMSRFIMQYLSDNNRWSSPKYLLGESYGTTRAAGIVDFLRNHYINFNGLILMSVATDLEALFDEIPGNDRPYPLFLPAYAAAAWYHHALPTQPPSLEPFLTEVRDYASGPYATALRKGDLLPDAERDAVADKLHEYTGLSVDYLKAANLRVPQAAFRQELLKTRHQTIGRLDARFVGTIVDSLEKNSDYDPQSEAISAPLAAAFLDYYHGELRFGQHRTYQTYNEGVWAHWKWEHKTARGSQPIVNSGVDLAETLTKDPTLRVLTMSGYYDLASPFSATEYVIAHLAVTKEARARLEMKYYEAGHMIYINPTALAKMKVDLDAFIESTSHR